MADQFAKSAVTTSITRHAGLQGVNGQAAKNTGRHSRFGVTAATLVANAAGYQIARWRAYSCPLPLRTLTVAGRVLRSEQSAPRGLVVRRGHRGVHGSLRAKQRAGAEFSREGMTRCCMIAFLRY